MPGCSGHVCFLTVINRAVRSIVLYISEYFPWKILPSGPVVTGSTEGRCNHGRTSFQAHQQPDSPSWPPGAGLQAHRHRGYTMHCAYGTGTLSSTAQEPQACSPPHHCSFQRQHRVQRALGAKHWMPTTEISQSLSGGRWMQ